MIIMSLTHGNCQVFKIARAISVCISVYLRQGFNIYHSRVGLQLTLQIRLNLNSQKSACFCLSSAGIKGIHFLKIRFPIAQADLEFVVQPTLAFHALFKKRKKTLNFYYVHEYNLSKYMCTMCVAVHGGRREHCALQNCGSSQLPIIPVLEGMMSSSAPTQSYYLIYAVGILWLLRRCPCC